MDYKELHAKYTPLITKILRRYPSFCREDLEQEAAIALFKAFDVWNPNKASFLTLAYRYITSACFKYMQDKAYVVRVPAHAQQKGIHAECLSLDQEIAEGLSLEDLFGSESREELYDLSITIWSKLKSLAEKRVISWRDFAFVYFRFFQQCEYRVLGQYFGCSDKRAHQKIQRIIQRIRPYFLERNRI